MTKPIAHFGWPKDGRWDVFVDGKKIGDVSGADVSYLTSKSVDELVASRMSQLLKEKGYSIFAPRENEDHTQIEISWHIDSGGYLGIGRKYRKLYFPDEE